MKKIIYILGLLSLVFFVAFSSKKYHNLKNVNPIPLSQIEVKGELYSRIVKNFDRLEETKYQPANLFLTDKQSGNWPGDTEGRTILGLVMDAQATKREPKYLNEIIRLIPKKLNAKGYMGKIHPKGVMDEQQFAGNGWMLRGLCEYYAWKKDKAALDIVRSIVENLFIPGKGLYKTYPIDPITRTKNVGEAMGNIDKKMNDWYLSTDIGCLFIGMDGAIQAYQYVPSENLKQIIDEMVARFLEIDLISIKAQTHATLTAMRGLLRYAEITGNKALIKEVSQRWKLYETYGMTENYGNYNWFTRYESATEPCAIVDSYMVISQLWMLTQNPEYLPYLDLIYYNALSHGQRQNGGFGCDKYLPSDKNSIIVHLEEAHWCCTMRGGEGLSKVAEYSYFTKGNSIYAVHLADNKAIFNLGKKSHLTIQQQTNYPFDGEVNFRISKVKNANGVKIFINALSSWADNSQVLINGKKTSFKVKDGFIELSRNWQENDQIKFLFTNKIRVEKVVNKYNYTNGELKVFSGPLLLGYSGEKNIQIGETMHIKQNSPMLFTDSKLNNQYTPLYHLMSSEVIKGKYKKQVIFPKN